MGNYKNPKKIKGQDKLDRMKNLMTRMNTLSESTSFSELELIKKGPNGITYGIIRENHNYFIKTCDKTTGELIAEDFNYIGGLQNKFSEAYKSYAEALKQLNLKFDMLNESFGIENNINIFESDGVAFGGGAGFGFVVEDEKEDDVIDEKTVLKVDAPAPEVPVEDEVEVDMGVSDDTFGVEDTEEVEVDEEDDGDSYTKKIQKLTGKVAQLVRDKDEADPELDKYVINSIISAINWEDIPDEDVEDIIAKIEGEDEEDGEVEGGEDIEMDFDAGTEEIEAEEEIAESDTLVTEDEEEDKEEHEDLDDKEDEEDEDELSHEDLKEKLKHHEDAIANIQKEIEDLSKDEKEDEEDKDEEEKEEKNESKTFSKKQLMESFLKKNANLSLKKVLKENYSICEECLGKGCASCEGLNEEDDNSSFIDIIKQNIKAAHDKGEKSPWDSAEPANVVKQKGWASLEEDIDITGDLAAQLGDDVQVVEQDMDIATAIATGQDYLAATGDLDRDGDKIPNRLDMDNNADGELDFESFDNNGDFIEIDIDALMGNNPAPAEPTTKPGTKPTTRPGKGKPRWKKIPKPGVNPKPKALRERKKPTLKRNGMYK